MIKPRAEKSRSALNAPRQIVGGKVRRSFSSLGNLQVVQLPSNVSVQRALELYRESGLVEFAEPDYILRAARVPNDPAYSGEPLWNLNNWGQLGGTSGSDIHAAEGWDLNTDASSFLVCVIDSGIRVTHEDLAGNLWTNPGEIPANGIDDDANGYIDDVHGINAIDGSGNLVDEPSHGTHVAGTLGAVGDNGTGIVGVAWRARIMGCKFLDANFEGAVSDAIECIEYAKVNGAKVINASWGGVTSGPFFSTALYDAIADARDAGIIFVAAAGNFALNNDDSSNAFFPASFDLDNIISVAATTRDDGLAHFSDYGADTVDLGAPGYVVYSCMSTADDAYGYDNGTSMSSPHVAAACALAWARFPNENYQQIIQRVLAGVDVIPALVGKCRTGGRLNLEKVLAGVPTANIPLSLTIVGQDENLFHFRIDGEAEAAVEIQCSTNLKDWTTIQNGQISDEGFLNCTDGMADGNKFYRVRIAEQGQNSLVFSGYDRRKTTQMNEK
ncbi:MAG TPA: S8 family peptidase [Verrucomicrobiae bacterium]